MIFDIFVILVTLKLKESEVKTCNFKPDLGNRYLCACKIMFLGQCIPEFIMITDIQRHL